MSNIRFGPQPFFVDGIDPRPWWRKLLCLRGKCPSREVHTEDGAGARCIRCKQISGWLSKAELRGFEQRLRQGRGGLDRVGGSCIDPRTRNAPGG